MEVVDKAGGLRDQYGHFCNEQGYILNEDGRYFFTKNYNAGRHQKPPQVSFYQSPPPPPAAYPNDELKAMMQLMLANEQKVSSDISTINGRLEAVTTHLKMLDTQVTQNAEALRDSHAMSLMEVDSVYMAEEEECVKLTEESNAVLHNRTVKELEDPGRSELPVQIDSTVLPRSLCDSGSAINTKPKVSHPRPPKYLMDPISPKQLLGFQKMVRRIPHALTFEEAIEYRPLLSHFRDCRESIEEIEILFLEARHTPPQKKLDTQVAQTTKAIKRPAGTLLGHGEVNPRKEDQVNVVELRSGRVLVPPTITTSHAKAKEKVTEHQAKESDFSEDNVHKEIGSSSGTHQDAVPIDVEEKFQRAPAPSTEHLLAQGAPTKIPETSPERVYVPRVPYLVPPKKSRKDLEDAKCKEMLKDLTVKLPLVDTVQMIPSLKRYMKGLVAGKVVQEESVMMVSKECSAILQSKVLTKKGDPGRSTKLPVGIIEDLHVPDPPNPDPDPDPKPLEHNETEVVEMSPKEAATPGSCHKRKFHDIILHPPLKRIRADSGAAVIPTAAYVIDPGDTYGVYSRGPRPPLEQWYVLFELPSSPTGTQSYPTRAHPDVAYLPDPEEPNPVYHMGPRPP